MEVTEKQKARILNGVEKVLKMEGFPKDFINQKKKEIAKVFDLKPDADGGKAQEITLKEKPFNELEKGDKRDEAIRQTPLEELEKVTEEALNGGALDELSDLMKHSDRYQL